MRRFRRRGKQLTAQLSPAEVGLLADLVRSYIALLDVPERAAKPKADPFARWEAELSAEAALDYDDPAIARLFPAAFPDDPGASAEFRRLTQERQRAERVAAAEDVLADLAETADGAYPLIVAVEDAPGWMKTMNALRLTLSVRLGIERAEDTAQFADLAAEDPRAFWFEVYEWLGFALETMLSAL